MTERVQFSYAVGAADAKGIPDHETYRTVLDDMEQIATLGFDGVWFFEHHFSDYYPTPSPLVLMAHTAARFPELYLGTGVLVLPWHQPLRLAAEISMVSSLTSADLNLGFGRGMAKFEYDRFGIPLEEGKARFNEIVEILKLALTEESFTYDGKYYPLEHPTTIRPRVSPEGQKRIRFFGPLTSEESAEGVGRQGMLPLSGTFAGDLAHQAKLLDAWKRGAGAGGHPSTGKFPIQVKCVVAETDEIALQQTQEHFPGYFQAQLDHYVPADGGEANLPPAQRAIFASWREMLDPANIQPWTKTNFIGSPDTVAAKVQEFIDLGFNDFIIQNSTPYIPRDVRRGWTDLFAKEVMPRFA